MTTVARRPPETLPRAPTRLSEGWRVGQPVLTRNSTYCGQAFQCSSTLNTCAYQIQYLSNDTSSTGVVVEDILHLISDDSQSNVANAQVTLG